jgi:DNA repair exonuclease SbcCD ATPase subunit
MDQNLTQRLSRVHATVSAIDQRLDYEAATVARLTARIKQIEEEKGELVKAVGTLDRAVQLVSANGIGKIEDIVSDGLRRVFGNDKYGLVIEKNETKRGNSYRILVRKGKTVGNPMDSFGGGVQNVAAFLLRIILIKRFKLAKFIALDEQFSNVSPEYQRRIASLLKTLSNIGFTIFAVSHQPAITAGADNVYSLLVECPHCGQDITPRSFVADGEVQYEVTPNPCSACGKEYDNAIPRLRKEANGPATQ